jgi:carbon-monoxide dehydrogenase medium subunit
MQVPAPVDYERAHHVDEAVALLERHGPGSRLIAGGHSLLPMMKLRLARPEVLIDINDLSDLAFIEVRNDLVRLGALARHRDVLASAALGERLPILHDAERKIADPIVRNRGTVGGSLCQADPSEDLSAAFAALKARVVVRGSGGTRTIQMEDFHEGPYQTAVGPAEILTEVQVPLRPGMGSAYEKVERRAGDWSIAAVGTCLWIEDGVVTDAGIGLAAVGAEHFRSPRAEAALIGQPPSEERFAEAAQIAAEDANPVADQRGPEDYKRHLVAELTLRSLRKAQARA